MEETHSGRISGHFAEKALYGILAKRYCWDGVRGDVRRHCRACLPCLSRDGTGRRLHPKLCPIPVGGPFERVAVDVLTLPQTEEGNRFAVVFVDYLTKWPEVFATPDHRAETIAGLLVEHVVCRHGAPKELLSDRGPDFLSELIKRVCVLIGTKKINTTAYHPQTDGMVERLNRTLIGMIAKHTEFYGAQWDRYLTYLLFAYRVKIHSSTGESPFYLLYGRDARLPTETALQGPESSVELDIDYYKTEMLLGMSTAWDQARENVESAQIRYKKQYDKSAQEITILAGERVMVKREAGKKGKLSCRYEGPYRVVEVRGNTVEVRPVEQPDAPTEIVNITRICQCPSEVPEGVFKSQRRGFCRVKARGRARKSAGGDVTT